MLSGGDGNDTLYGDGRVIVDTHGTGGSGPIVTYGDVAELTSPSRPATTFSTAAKATTHSSAAAATIC